MECIESRALKPSFISQMDVETNNNSQVLQNDNVWCLAGINGDEFPVEDLLNLDFPESELQEGFCLSQGDDEEKVAEQNNSNQSSSTFSGADEFDTLSAGELAVPVDDLENLEWLSQFVDDSSALSLLCPARNFTENGVVQSENRAEPLSRPVQAVRPRYFPVPIPTKPRSKRRRDIREIKPVLETDRLYIVEIKPPAKKQKRSKSEGDCRRCSHCQVQKTPQWRTGPLGPKTLCNACGVRFKSGQLFPEYRPACSPTFSKDVHSNSHRKVLEMRRKKEVVGGCLC